MKKLLSFFVSLFSLAAFAQSGIGFTSDFSVTFETGKWDLGRVQRKEIRDYCEQLKYNREEIGIMGYSDISGTDRINDTLSLKRARALRDCIHEFLPLQKINVFIGHRTDFHLLLPPDEQRRAIVVRGLLCGTIEEPLKYSDGMSHTIFVVPELLAPVTENSKRTGREIMVTTFWETRHKIANGINAIDSSGTAINAVGIAKVCVDDEWAAPNGYRVYVPSLTYFDNHLKLYTRRDTGDPWKETSVKIDVDGHYYIFDLEEQKGCIYFCLGKAAKKTKKQDNVIEKIYKTVYISTYRPFKFKDVAVQGKHGSLLYAAIINDTVMAFTTKVKSTAMHMVFEGTYDDGGTEKKVSVPMSKFRFSRNRDGNDYYYMTKESLEPEKKKRTFWQRLGDLFR